MKEQQQVSKRKKEFQQHIQQYPHTNEKAVAVFSNSSINNNASSQQ